MGSEPGMRAPAMRPPRRVGFRGHGRRGARSGYWRRRGRSPHRGAARRHGVRSLRSWGKQRSTPTRTLDGRLGGRPVGGPRDGARSGRREAAIHRRGCMRTAHATGSRPVRPRPSALDGCEAAVRQRGSNASLVVLARGLRKLKHLLPQTRAWHPLKNSRRFTGSACSRGAVPASDSS
jgi:hypothetical protein